MRGRQEKKVVDPANSGDIMGFFEKNQGYGLDNEDEASKSIQQLGLHSIMLGLDHNILMEATTRIMERIVRGERSS